MAHSPLGQSEIDRGVDDVLTALTDQCVQLLDVAGASVALAAPEGGLRLVASSSEAVRRLELDELHAAEGLCFEAVATGALVDSDDPGARGRWPQLVGAAFEAGYRWMCAMPLRQPERTVGALKLFGADPSPIGDHDMKVARALADLAAVSVVQSQVASELLVVKEQLTRALTSRIVIEQAKGVIGERAGVDMDEAFNRLRRYARSRHLLLRKVAEAAVDGTLEPQAWAPPPRS